MEKKMNSTGSKKIALPAFSHSLLNARRFQCADFAPWTSARIGRQRQAVPKLACGMSLLIALSLLGLSVGCFQEPITVVKIPKESPAYVVPDHWTPAPSRLPMRSVSLSFAIADEHGHSGEVSVLPMRPFHVDDVEIVNLWRQQLGLEPATSEQAARDATGVKIGPFDGKLFDLESPKRSGDSSGHEARMLTAYLHQTNRTWFFKLAGPGHLVETEKASFLRFLESVNFHKIQQEIQSRDSFQTASPTLQTAPRSREMPRWNAPENWQSAPATSSVLLARFHISQPQEGDAEMTVSVLSGDGGGLLPNVNRWRRQISLAPLEPESLGDVTRPLDLDGERKGVLVDMSGGESRVLVAVVSVGEETWFYKMTGAPGVIEKEMNAFTGFVRSVQYPGDD